MIGQWRWALLEDDDLTPTMQHIALVLAVRMNPDGTIPSQYAPGSRRIASDSKRKKMTVLETLRDLVEAGWLEKVSEGSGPRPDEYRATFPSGSPRAPASGSPSVPTRSELVGPLQELVGPLEHDSGSSSVPTTSTPAHTSTSARYNEQKDETFSDNTPEIQRKRQEIRSQLGVGS